MKDKILNGLKTAYPSLSDDMLNAQTSILMAAGYVTEDNLSAVIAAQKPLVEIINSKNKKISDDINKKYVEELEKGKKANERLVILEQELNDIKSKAVSGVAGEKGEKSKSNGTEPDFKAMIESMKAELQSEYQKNIAELLKSQKGNTEMLNSLKQENEAFKREKTIEERNNFIRSTAKGLGIPQWRIEEGFVLPEDAENDTIVKSLSTIANNVKTQLLPASEKFPLGNDTKEISAMVAEISKSLIN